MTARIVLLRDVRLSPPAIPWTMRPRPGSLTAMLRFLLHLVVFAVLTLLTQIGGLAYLMALAFAAHHDDHIHVEVR